MTPQQEIFETLKAIIERPSRPAGETDDELFAQLRKCEQLRPDQMLHVVSSAIAVYDWAIQRNIDAMRIERRRMQEQIHRLHQEVGDNRQRIGRYHNSSQTVRRDALIQIVLQRMKLDEDTVDIERKSTSHGALSEN